MKNKAMPEAPERPAPPYLSYRTFRNFIESLRSGIPGKIDRSVMRSLSGASQSMLIGTLRYFNLIAADGTPTEALNKLVQAEPVDRQMLLRDLLRAGYPFIFGGAINLENATPKQVHEAFAGAGVSGDTTRKAVVFLLSAAKDADITLSQYLKVRQIKAPAKRRGAARVNGGVEREDVSREGTEGVQIGSQKTPYEMLIDILDPEAMDEEEQKAVWTLIRYLKKREGETTR